VLHPPYTLWHLSYVALGAAMAPALDLEALGASLLAFFLAVGLAAHALDEHHGRPLGTAISDEALVAVAVAALLGAGALGVAGVLLHGPVDWLLAVAVPVGALLVVGYNLELFGGRLHTDATFAWAWGGFPVAVGFVAQAPDLTWSSGAAAVAAVLAGVGTAAAQRALSTTARDLRRRTASVDGTVHRLDGSHRPLDREALLLAPEQALRALCWAMPALAVAALLAHV
jgi:hypothetical protein